MKVARLLVAAAVLTVCAVSTGFAEDETREIEIRVVDASTDEPVPAAYASIRKADGGSLWGGGVGEGRVVVTLPLGQLVFEPSAGTEYRQHTSHPFEVTPTTTVVVIRLERAPIVAGRVVDEDGSPVADARVHIGLYTLGTDTRTDAKGRFELGVGYGNLAPLWAWKNGFCDTRLDVPAGTIDVELVLRRGATIEGRLIAPKGADLPAQVRVISSHDNIPCIADVASDGRFVATGFSLENPKLKRRIGVRADGYSALIQTRRLRGARFQLGTIELVRSRELVVTALDHRSRPFTGVLVRVEASAWSALSWDGRTDNEGRVRFADVDRRALRVTARRDGPRAPIFERLVAADYEVDRSDLRIRILPDVTLTGSLEWGSDGDGPWVGEDPVDVLVQVFDGDRQQTTLFGKTAGQGSNRFEVHGARPGTWNLRVSVALTSNTAVRIDGVEIPVMPGGERFDLGALTVGGP